ncbi:carboxymuconolactone decarboxylase family protein [Paraflavisolibacter sp. H34]|uniref:carboxymuconolactone decarboxylase family protein n=1 Tax=Huijunlia imazamoxiresistens TaxID=3127457 RepID=UPI0030190D07
MEQRFNFQQSHPEAYKALYHLSVITAKSSLTPIQRELIKIRASQINGCAFCIDMHTKEALQIGETQQRIFLLNAWRETDLFTEEEKALLAVTEEVTLLHQKGISDATYRQAEKCFSPQVIGDIVLATLVINSWNRIAVSSLLPVPR